MIATKTAERDAKGAAAHIDNSLRLLKTDWIDIYQLHNVSNEEALEKVLAPQGAYRAVCKARDAGKIRFIGLSSHSISTAMEAIKTGLFQTLQFPFNFIENDPQNAYPLKGLLPGWERPWKAWRNASSAGSVNKSVRIACRLPIFSRRTWPFIKKSKILPVPEKRTGN